MYLQEIIPGLFIAATLRQALGRQGSCPHGTHSLAGGRDRHETKKETVWRMNEKMTWDGQVRGDGEAFLGSCNLSTRGCQLHPEDGPSVSAEEQQVRQPWVRSLACEGRSRPERQGQGEEGCRRGAGAGPAPGSRASWATVSIFT